MSRPASSAESQRPEPRVPKGAPTLDGPGRCRSRDERHVRSRRCPIGGPGDWWTLDVISGLPADVLGVSQARRLTAVPTVARNLIGDLLDIDPATVDVNLLD